jgi:2-polyprenyl-6-methoxyphenol hydroxylase-like FAD-dependent oxidoreductase
MLRVRVLMYPLAGGEAQTIWDRPLHAKHEDRKLQEFRELSWDTRKFGERLEMRFDDGAGSHCRVDARFEGALISSIEGGTQVELTFAGDKYRVW